MPKTIMLDELHLTFKGPDNLSKPNDSAIWRLLTSRRFRRQLRDAIRGVMRRHAALRPVRWTLR